MKLPVEEKEWKKLNYVARTKVFDIPKAKESHDSDEWAEVQRAFDAIGLTQDQIESFFYIIAGVLHIGEIVVRPVGDTEEVEAVSQTPLENVEDILQIDPEAGGCGLFSCCAKKFRMIDGREMPCPRTNVQEAQNAFHCMARAIFEKTFLWMIGRINSAVKPTDDNMRWAGVLDIFGFEIMAVNSL